jgi:hypothetical protein
MTFKESMSQPVTMKWWQFQLCLYGTAFGCMIVSDILRWAHLP